MIPILRTLTFFIYGAFLLCGMSYVRAAGSVQFGRQIQPILSKNCLACHGADEHDRKAGLRLDTYEGATRDNKGVRGIVPGDPPASALYQRITSTDPDEVMPPPEHGHTLSPEDVALVSQWIKEGARYEKHWSFIPPVKVAVPADEKYPNEIDYFVAGQLAEQGLTASPPADPYELLRRVSLDLTGLPPSFEEAQAFAADPSLARYTQHVDRLLASPHYGEHWAAMWLDLARYADSIGYSGDPPRDIWPWRDWVIAAFNKNMPYDQFTIEQLAGDLLPGATEAQRLATAFHRNTLSNNEGGTDDEEFRVAAVKDRINTVVNVWMGLTMRCAECHTHKYDPISQKEYYQFFDYFNQTADSDHKDDRPKLETRPGGRDKALALLQAELADIAQKLTTIPEPWSLAAPLSTQSRDGSTLTVLADHSVEASGKNPPQDHYETTFQIPAGQTVTGLRMEILPSAANGHNTGRAADGASVITRAKLFLRGGAEPAPLLFTEVVADYQENMYEAKHLIDPEPSQRGYGINHERDGYRVGREVIFSLAQPLVATSATTLSFAMEHASPISEANTARYRLAWTTTAQPAHLYRKNTLDPLRRRARELHTQLAAPVRVPVLVERPSAQRRTTHIMAGGNFRSPGERVTAAVPIAFHPYPPAARGDRLGVAQWIMAKENPLTARVAVNRFWARLFGLGLVETEEDFGLMGFAPTHPELLDWLAVDFMEHRWDVQRLLKKIVLSTTYRQTAKLAPELMEKDRRNRFLARGARMRLPAEVIRDQALVASGLFTSKTYGPPVFPPNPIKKVSLGFTGGITWTESTDEDRYRRAIYTYLKRTSPHPLFDTFDMASREVCALRRIRTNTPLQSFMTLNDAAFIEAAQGLASRMAQHAPHDPAAAIRHGLECALVRPAAPSEITTLLRLYQDILPSYEADPEAAQKMAGQDPMPAHIPSARLAALSVVGNVILNLDGFLVR